MVAMMRSMLGLCSATILPMVIAEALDFPGAVTQGFDLPDARLMIASAMEAWLRFS